MTKYGSNTLSVYRNISDSGSVTSGSFANSIDLPTGTYPAGVAIGDLDGDGKPASLLFAVQIRYQCIKISASGL